MNSWTLLIFSVLSLGVLIYFVVKAVKLYQDSNRSKRVFAPVHFLTFGVFLAIVLVQLPLSYAADQFKDSVQYIRPFLSAVIDSLRVFIVDAEMDPIVDLMLHNRTIVRVCFSLYLSGLYLIAPLLTFGNVVSLFKNIWDEFRFIGKKSRNYFVLSELNEKSIALAKSIRRDHKKAVIVFADVFQNNDEKDHELLTQASEIKAVCLKRDIFYVNFFSKKGDVEIFLIGNDESKNVSQAVKITNEINRRNTKRNIKVFVFSMQPSAAYIVDSIKYDNLMECTDRNGECFFKLRRINEKQQLIWNTVPKMNVFEIAQRHNKTLSVMLVGFGNYGVEFFKMLLWYCQFEGYDLQINILDKQKDSEKDKERKEDHLQAVINRACPELLKKNRSTEEGDAHYDIRTFSGVDVRSSDIDELLLYEGTDPDKIEIAERLKRTNLAIVSLGDDDINIEISIHLRSLFDRVNGIKAKKDIDISMEAVEIYSIVYDDQKSSILSSENAAKGEASTLRNHQDVPYHIHFIGSMSAQFDYHNIYNAKLESIAYQQHVGWADIEEKIYNEWLENDDFANLENHQWYFRDAKSKDEAKKARKKYDQYEYYRLSSIAKELYQQGIKNTASLRDATACLEDGRQTCECENCVRRKRSEHMRWNAYTRTIGFSYKDGIRADRAMLHDNLCAWQRLSDLDRLKD